MVAFGTEGEGLSREIAIRADFSVGIAPRGDRKLVGVYPFNIVDSLNVAVAAGIVLSHVRSKFGRSPSTTASPK